jgi:hypothetical protein
MMERSLWLLSREWMCHSRCEDCRTGQGWVFQGTGYFSVFSLRREEAARASQSCTFYKGGD